MSVNIKFHIAYECNKLFGKISRNIHISKNEKILIDILFLYMPKGFKWTDERVDFKNFVTAAVLLAADKFKNPEYDKIKAKLYKELKSDEVIVKDFMNQLNKSKAITYSFKKIKDSQNKKQGEIK